MSEYDIEKLTTEDFASLVQGEMPVVVMIPVGSVEPHGPHLSLATDMVISHSAAIRAAKILEHEGLIPLIAPSVPYGVTECAKAFKGAISVSSDALTAYLLSAVEGFLANDVEHVCLINNHLEPAHDSAVRAAIADIEPGKASVACPLTKRWARTLSDEFKSGACHAGRYETSIMLAVRPDLVNDDARSQLPEVPISLSDKLKSGVTDFVEMGLKRAYSGTPAQATEKEGNDMLDRLAEMIAAVILEALGKETDGANL